MMNFIRSKKLLLVASLLLIVGALFFGFKGAYSRSGMLDRTGVDGAILAQAEAVVPQPVLPPKPAGKTVTTTERKTVEEKVPVTRRKTVNLGFGLKTAIPETVMETHSVTREIPVTRLVDAPPDQVLAWNAAAAEARRRYDAAVDAEVMRLVREEAAKRRGDLMEGILKMVKEGIVPLILAITGLMGAVAALKQGAAKGRSKARAGRGS